MLVWAEIDGGISFAVTQLMNMPGVLTHASCQGGNGGGPCPEYPPYVMVTWKDDAARARIIEHFDLTEEGDRWAYAHPRFADDGLTVRKVIDHLRQMKSEETTRADQLMSQRWSDEKDTFANQHYYAADVLQDVIDEIEKQCSAGSATG